MRSRIGTAERPRQHSCSVEKPRIKKDEKGDGRTNDKQQSRLNMLQPSFHFLGHSQVKTIEDNQLVLI